jgi:hypothetical protein
MQSVRVHMQPLSMQQTAAVTLLHALHNVIEHKDIFYVRGKVLRGCYVLPVRIQVAKRVKVLLAFLTLQANSLQE